MRVNNGYALICKQILPTDSLRECIEDQSAEFVCGYWGLKGFRRQLPRNFKIVNKLILFCIVLHVGILAMQGNVFLNSRH